jgi:hypothetical protein
VTIDDVLSAELEAGRPVPTEVTPGSFRGSADGITEQMHFVAGHGTITGSDGVVTEIRPGVVMLCPDGWSGLWDVRETVRKTYAIVKTG